jgi:hypothetical protein
MEVSGQLHAPAALSPGKKPVSVEKTPSEPYSLSGRFGEDNFFSLIFVNYIFNSLSTQRINRNERNFWITLNPTVFLAIINSSTDVIVEERREICLFVNYIIVTEQHLCPEHHVSKTFSDKGIPV